MAWNNTNKYVYFVLSDYWRSHLSSITEILKYIEVREKIIEKTDDYVKVISEIPDLNSKLIWNKTDTDFLELVMALLETGSIQNQSLNLTQKEALESFSQFFNIEVKDPYKKLNAARNRKKEDPSFTYKLNQALEEYYKKQDTK